MLQQLSIYLLKVTSISGLLFLYYYIALRNKQFHFYNRFYILITVAISAVLPFLQLQWFTFFSTSPQTIHLFNIISGKGENNLVVSSNSSFSMQQILLYALTAANFIMVLVLIMRIIRIYNLKRKYTVQRLAEFNFINTDITSAPFSFFKNIFWRKDISLIDETGKQILQHEIAHVQQKHSWDKLFMQFVLCFYWLNPFYHFLKHELYIIHEFIADEKAVKHSDADAFAKMLLTAQFGKFDFLPAQPFFYSSIKRRLIMLTTSKKPQFNYMRRIMALPLTATLICLFAFTIKKIDTSSSSQKILAAKPFVLVVDAGHGGNDYGAAANGLYEKDVTLKIAERIKSLSSQYGINVILTRSNDVFMSPPDKSDFSNSQNADALISIHVNANDKDHPKQSGFEVLLPNNNEYSAQNKILGSAILQTIKKDFKTTSTLQQTQTGVWILKNSNIPSAIIECGYITNSTDAQLLKDDAKIELMAKNILQGVAIYANNAVNKSSSYQLQDAELNDTMPSAKALYILDGKIVTKDKADKVDPNTIESVYVWKDKYATAKYGDKAKNGVVVISTKKGVTVTKLTDDVLYVLDGKIISKEQFDKIDHKELESINVLKDKNAIDKYGDQGKNGVVEIALKSSV